MIVVVESANTWISYPGTSIQYMYVTQCRGWKNSVTYCESLGGELASGSTTAKRDYLVNTVYDGNSTNGSCSSWYGSYVGGITDKVEAVNWFDGTVTKFSQIDWDLNENEPDNLNSHTVMGFKLSSKKWHTVYPGDSNVQFCQRILSPSPTASPITDNPTPAPTANPTPSPTANPTPSPTNNPTPSPTDNPTPSPTDNPTPAPTNNPTPSPTNNPTPSPTDNPTPAPTTNPTPSPTDNPTPSPTNNPTPNPTNNPTPSPTTDPTKNPTKYPANVPTKSPTMNPTETPSTNPTKSPSNNPTVAPTDNPSSFPSNNPTISPSNNPTITPSTHPSDSPSKSPSKDPTVSPSNIPSTSPTNNPSISPSNNPSISPSKNPSIVPTANPISSPTLNSIPSPNNPSTKLSVQTTSNPASMAAAIIETTLNPTSTPIKADSSNKTDDGLLADNMMDKIVIILMLLIVICGIILVITYIRNKKKEKHNKNVHNMEQTVGGTEQSEGDPDFMSTKNTLNLDEQHGMHSNSLSHSVKKIKSKLDSLGKKKSFSDVLIVDGDGMKYDMTNMPNTIQLTQINTQSMMNNINGNNDDQIPNEIQMRAIRTQSVVTNDNDNDNDNDNGDDEMKEDITPISPTDDRRAEELYNNYTKQIAINGNNDNNYYETPRFPKYKSSQKTHNKKTTNLSIYANAALPVTPFDDDNENNMDNIGIPTEKNNNYNYNTPM